MLKRFEVTNFKNFNKKFVFDFSETKNYAFNESCIVDGTVKTGMIYGPNGCGKSNLGYAIFDIQAHLTDNKIDPIYSRDYLNAENSSEIAEFSYTFQFGNFTLEYSYGKFAIDKFAYETIRINEEKVISYNRNEDELATILLEGTENLNKKLGDSNLSVVKYVGGNSVFDNNITNMVFDSFLKFVNIMSLLHPIGMHNYIAKYPNENWLSIIVNKKRGYTLEQFEKFINEAGVKCKLAIVKSLDDDRLVFDFENNKLDFLNNASSGTQVLTSLYMDLLLLRLRIESVSSINELYKLKTEQLKLRDEIQGKGTPTIAFKPFVFVDEFDAFYHHHLSQLVVKDFRDLDAQVIFTTHNTSIMTNDLLRPDCYFTMNGNSIKPLYQNTIKDLRKAHSLEKMYRAGAFNE